MCHLQVYTTGYSGLERLLVFMEGFIIDYCADFLIPWVVICWQYYLPNLKIRKFLWSILESIYHRDLESEPQAGSVFLSILLFPARICKALCVGWCQRVRPSTYN